MSKLQLITISPIVPIGPDKIDYISRHPFKRGQVVTIPYGKREIYGIVINSIDASSKKDILRKSTISFKRITELKVETTLPEELLLALENIAHSHASSVGTVFEQTIPIKARSFIKEIKNNDAAMFSFHEFALQDEFYSRIGTLRSIEREAHARNENLIVVSPSQNHLKLIASQFNQPSSIILSSSTSISNIKKAFENIFNPTCRNTFLVTPQWAFLASLKRATVVLEQDGSSFYKKNRRPFIDMRIAVSIFTESQKGNLIHSDILLDIDTLHRHKKNDIKDRYGVDFTIEGSAEINLVSMRREDQNPTSETDRIFSSEVQGLISKSLKEKSSLLLYTLRKGFMPILLCADCGNRTIRSSYYDTINRYKRGKFDSPILTNDDVLNSIERCASCSSWRLVPHAIAIEQVLNILQSKFGDVCASIHGDQSIKEQKNQLEQFLSGTTPILLTTEIGLGLLTSRVNNSAVISIDSLFSIPDLGITEKITRTLLHIHELTKEKMILQTRNPSSSILSYLTKGTLLPLIRQEIKEREELDYPPFCSMIKITLKGNAPSTPKIIELIRTEFKDIKKEMYPSIKSRDKSGTIVILMRVKNQNKKEILSRIRMIPLEAEIDCTPVSLL